MRTPARRSDPLSSYGRFSICLVFISPPEEGFVVNLVQFHYTKSCTVVKTFAHFAAKLHGSGYDFGAPGAGWDGSTFHFISLSSQYYRRRWGGAGWLNFCTVGAIVAYPCATLATLWTIPDMHRANLISNAMPASCIWISTNRTRFCGSNGHYPCSFSGPPDR